MFIHFLRSGFHYGLLCAFFILGGCAGDGNDPWENEDYTRPARGAPNQLSKSSLSDPDLFYANSQYSVRQIGPGDKAEVGVSGDGDKSHIPYQRFKQTLQDFSRQQQEVGQDALDRQRRKQDLKQEFLGAKLPDDPGTAPGLPQHPQEQSHEQSHAKENSTQYASAYYQGDPSRSDYSNQPRQSQLTKRTLGPRQASVRAALLVPLSGEHQHIGQAMLRAAETAIFNLGAGDYQILPKDTKGTAAGARDAAIDAVNDGADVILGPLFGHSARAVKPIARDYDLKVFSFTTDWTVADEIVFTMGFLPFSQVRKILEHAQLEGHQRIGVFAPDTDYGRAVIHSYQKWAQILGLETVRIVRYPVNGSDISPIIREFTNYDERVEALNQLIRPLREEQKLRPEDKELAAQIQELESLDTYGEAPYDAVLLPVGGEQAKAIANLLSFYDLDSRDVARLGTGLWDDVTLSTEPNMVGARFAASSPESRIAFENQYKKLYGSKPPRLSSLAYDATALTVVLGRNQLIRGERDTDLFKVRDITDPNGYAGIDGIFRFRPTGVIERGLAILTFTNRKTIRVIEPAPATFQDPDRF